jgi:tetratricopeptide (TPR) repeat protein/mono/diheme cytochrome c family protein
VKTTVATAAIAAALIFGDAASGLASQASGFITFTEDVAPIIFAHCATCHQPGGSGPFSLLTSADLKTRARLIEAVVEARVMPPWKPEPGHGDFVDSRRLTSRQIETIVGWFQQGTAEGDRARLPPPPPPADRWQLGVPDLIVTMAEPYHLSAGGHEVFRNFVLPVPIPAKRYVKAWEFRPDNARIVHHATLHLDPTRSARRLDEQDPDPGYEGLVPFSVRDPAGYFLGWTPGQRPFVSKPENAWVLEKDTDLVVMMHMKPTGKPETIRASIGLYFSTEPPSHVPATLRLGSQTIDIEPGAREYKVTDSYTLPVDVELHTVYPHAHYLAREMKAGATFPDGTTRSLLLIRQWDFNWQDVYRYVVPVPLPAGTTLSMEYTYDNSADNPYNINRPPRRVTFGKNTSDEMGDLWLQVVPRNPADLPLLTHDFETKLRPENIRGLETILRAEPDNDALHNEVALLYQDIGNLDKAVAHFTESLRIKPKSAAAQYNLGTTLLARGNSDAAIAHFREALQVQPDYTAAHNNLGIALQQQRKFEEAERHYLESIRITPDDATAYYNLGAALQLQGKVADAVDRLRTALRIRPGYAAAAYTLGIALSSEGRTQEAIEQYRTAIEAAPDWPVPMIKVGWILATSADPSTRRPGEALILAERAAQIVREPSPAVLDVLAAALAALGEFERASAAAERALTAAVAAQNDDVAAEIRQRLSLYRSSQPYIAR